MPMEIDILYIGSHRHWHWPHRHHHHVRPVLVFGQGRFALTLVEGQTLHMATTLQVGDTDNLHIEFLDTAGQPMKAPPTLDNPPAWSQSTAATESLTVSGDSMTAVQAALAAGSDTITVDVSVGGQQFQATYSVTVSEKAQTLGSISIVGDKP